jgi:hypothetical protein
LPSLHSSQPLESSHAPETQVILYLGPESSTLHRSHFRRPPIPTSPSLVQPPALPSALSHF